MASTKQPWDISYTDAAALARTDGLRNAGDRVRAALANGEIHGDRRGATMWCMRADFDRWLERALASDREDSAEYYKLEEARALARAAGLKSASDRVYNAASGGEIAECFKDVAGWWIPKAGFSAWLEFVCAEGQAVDDGCINLTEANAIATAHGLPGSRQFLLLACLDGSMPGAYRDGSSWRMPMASVEDWVAVVCAEVERRSYIPPAPPWWQTHDAKVLLAWVIVAIVAWCIALSV